LYIGHRGGGMPIKSIIALVIFVFVVLPSFINLLSFTINSITSPPEKVAGDGAKLIAEEVIPWWVGIIQWLASLPSLFAASFIVGFIFFLRWIGEI
jgi:hypothetical protein